MRRASLRCQYATPVTVMVSWEVPPYRRIVGMCGRASYALRGTAAEAVTRVGSRIRSAVRACRSRPLSFPRCSAPRPEPGPCCPSRTRAPRQWRVPESAPARLLPDLQHQRGGSRRSAEPRISTGPAPAIAGRLSGRWLPYGRSDYRADADEADSRVKEQNSLPAIARQGRIREDSR